MLSGLDINGDMECIPFMFNLILNVIRDREKQFQYPEKLERKLFESSGRENFPLIIPFGTFASGTSDDLPGKMPISLCRYLQEVCDVEISVNQLDTLQSADFIYIGRQFPLDETTLPECCKITRRNVSLLPIFTRREYMPVCGTNGLKSNCIGGYDVVWDSIFDDKIQEGGIV